MTDIVVTAHNHVLGNPEAFYAKLRRMTGSLDTVQVQTIQGLFDATPHWPVGWLAYGLATAWHECRLKPQREWGSRAYLDKYDTGSLAKALGNTPEDDDDGILYAGRGLVQLTGARNYRNAGAYLGLDLLGKPDLALAPDNAARILVWGMQTGAFTGKKLADYMVDRGTHDAFVRCRRIINGSDKSEQIAGYADVVQDALTAGEYK